MLTDAVNSAADAELKLKLQTETEEGKAEAGAEVEAHPTSQAKPDRAGQLASRSFWLCFLFNEKISSDASLLHSSFSARPLTVTDARRSRERERNVKQRTDRWKHNIGIYCSSASRK